MLFATCIPLRPGPSKVLGNMFVFQSAVDLRQTTSGTRSYPHRTHLRRYISHLDESRWYINQVPGTDQQKKAGTYRIGRGVGAWVTE